MKPYIPTQLPLSDPDYKRLFPLVGDANAELARYDGLLQGIINPSILLSPLTTREAVLSSRIEGTQATVNEVLEQEAGLIKEEEKSKDIQEILNYRQALTSGYEHLKQYPVSLSFICQMHKILLNSVRGQDKTPGEFRKTQNRIGSSGCTMEEASFIPPSPLQLQDHLEAWKSYLEMDDIDLLFQTALVHAQFELLHPFQDGNGRIGRILIPLFLYQKKKISQPMFYLSSYLEANREEYYSRLQNISRNGDWNGWIEFFLKAVIIQARKNSDKVKEIMKLYKDKKTEIHNLTRSQYTVFLLDFIFNSPVFKTTRLIKSSGIKKPTASHLLRKLKESGLLKEIHPAEGSRPAILIFPELLNITERDD